MRSANIREPARILGEAPTFMQVLEDVSQIAPLNRPVLVVGERGTGKELIAARLHYLSNRWEGEYLTLNCAAISESLLESELFGHEAGAFTGATSRHAGRFERADGGTLFLDELATTSGLIQEKLLRVIEYGEFERLGGSRTLRADVRLVAATNEDLPGLAANGRFRSDLLDRLAFDVITLPPLRARREDILLLANHFGVTMASELGRDFFPGFAPAARQLLLDQPWPGNVRELKNTVERSVYRWDSEEPIGSIVLDPFESPFRPQSSPRASGPPASGSTSDRTAQAPGATAADAGLPAAARATHAGQPRRPLPTDLKQAIRDQEIDWLRGALAAANYNQRKAADLLSLTYHQLRGYIKKYQLLDRDDASNNGNDGTSDNSIDDDNDQDLDKSTDALSEAPAND